MAFRVFNHIDQLDSVAAQPASKEFYAMLDRLQVAAKTQTPAWSAYQNFMDYAEVCFWAIRKHEYSFIAESFAEIEAQAAHPLRVLDVGCGVVPMCNWISSRGHQVFAFDPLEADMEFLVKNDLNGFYGSDVHYHLSRGEQLPYTDETFDVVTCASVLEHVTPGNDLLTLWEIARVLKPGGSLLITFDVSPDPIESRDTDAAVDRRVVAAPFTMRTAQKFVAQLARVFEVAVDDLPTELNTLTWDELHRLWRAVQQHDGRTTPERHYLAVGNVLKRREQFTTLSADQMNLAYLQGEGVLERRAAFFEYHAAERYNQIVALSEAHAELLASHQKLRQSLTNPVSLLRLVLGKLFEKRAH